MALEEVAANRSRMRKFEAFLLREVERLRLRVKLLEVDRAKREAELRDTKDEKRKGVVEVPTVPYINTPQFPDQDPDKTPVYGKKRLK